jgi:hypothetical protein
MRKGIWKEANTGENGYLPKKPTTLTLKELFDE